MIIRENDNQPKYTKEAILLAWQRAILRDGYNIAFTAWLELNGFTQDEDNGYEIHELYDNDLEYEKMKPSDEEPGLKLLWRIKQLEHQGSRLQEYLAGLQSTVSEAKHCLSVMLDVTLPEDAQG